MFQMWKNRHKNVTYPHLLSKLPPASSTSSTQNTSDNPLAPSSSSSIDPSAIQAGDHGPWMIVKNKGKRKKPSKSKTPKIPLKNKCGPRKQNIYNIRKEDGSYNTQGPIHLDGTKSPQNPIPQTQKYPVGRPINTSSKSQIQLTYDSAFHLDMTPSIDSKSENKY